VTEYSFVQRIGASGYWATDSRNPDGTAVPTELWEKYLAAQCIVDELEAEIEEYTTRG
jgi:hypothetical protein